MRNININIRVVVFWSILLATFVLIAAFGLPYGQFGWGDKAWAQDIYAISEQDRNPQQAILASPIADFLPEGGGNLIFGREDTNEDGIIDALDGLFIFIQVSGEDGETFVPLDLGNDAISEVLAYQFDEDGYGVIAIKLADNSTAVYLINEDGTATQIQGLPVLNSPVVQLGSLYVANNSATNNPVTLYVIDDETGDLLALRELDRSNTTVSFDPDAEFMLAFTPTSRLLRIYNLSNVQGNPLSFQFTGNIAVVPQWSPAGNTLFYVEEDLNTRTESVAIIEASAGNKQTITLPDYADDLDVIGSWSETGRFITFFAVNGDASLTDAPVSIIDTDDSSQIVLEVSGTAFVPYDWSADDSYLLYLSHGLDTPDSYFLGLYDAVNVTTINIELGGNVPLAMAWHPTDAQLAILTANVDSLDVLTYDVASGEIETVATLDAAPYTAVSIRWLGDTELAVAMTFDDLVIESVLNATYRINTLTGESIELIPESVRLN
ncbi:MAG: hypothetical protein RLP44_09000 [Aggregatilineales bacterium]